MFPVLNTGKKILVGLIFCLILSGLVFQPVLADGIVIPDPPPIPIPITLEESWLTIRYHNVSVTIENQIAITRVEQEFVNQHDWEVEGTYIFPIPEGASLSEFVMWVDGIPVEGKILPAEEARMIYEEIVRERRDPALLEYIGQGAVQARIFPIPPGGSRKIDLEYSQVLPIDNGLVKYVYPLNTEKFSAQALENCSVRVEILSDIPLRSLYSPTHQDRIFVERDGDQRALIGYEEQNVLPDQDFELVYTVSQQEIGLNLLTYVDESESVFLDQAGYFLLMVSPSIEVDQIVPRDIVLVLDTSGSMEGEKLVQAKAAAAYVLQHLNQEDRFNVIAFSTGVKHFAYDLQPRSRASEALAWLEGMPALGGTNINQALLEAASLRNPTEDSNTARPLVLLFLTDGLPTEGVTEIDQILANIRGNSTHYLRLFAFGVGDDVNTELLDTLASENRGLASYVRPGERIDEEVSTLFAKIKTPVLTNIKIDFGDVLVDEIYPPVLPDLYAGSQLILTGRYRVPVGSSGRTNITLAGEVNSRVKTYQYQADFDNSFDGFGSNSYIPRLWATRKIGYLLNQIRYQGENKEWVDAIVQLSIRYGIVTPYTSFLVTEPEFYAGEGLDQAAEELMESYSGPAVGAEAVEKADAESNLRSAESIPHPTYSDPSSDSYFGQPVLRYIGDKTFLYQDGLWIDSQYDPGNMTPLTIGFGSEVYFELISSRADLGKILALGDQIIFVVDGKAYQIVPGEGEVEEVPLGFQQDPQEHTVNPEGEVSSLPTLRSICNAPILIGLVLFGWEMNKGKSAKRKYQ
jgi:Ca-activated chloride channel family protein